MNRALSDLLPESAIVELVELANAGRYHKRELMVVIERYRETLIAKGCDPDYLGYVLELQFGRMIDERPAIHRLPRHLFPLKFQIISRHGMLLWETTIAAPEDVAAVAIPGFAGTDHVPVSVRIEYADGSITSDSETVH